MGIQADFFRDAYDLAYQVSPIALTGGIAAGIPGGVLPISLLIGGIGGFLQGALSSGGLSMQDFPWRFIPQSGTQVISQSIGEYPFATRQIAANATIENPLSITYKLIAPVKDSGGYITKLPIFTSLRESLNSHNNAGGTYTIIMPSIIFSDCVMLDMSEAGGAGKQQQTAWHITFRKPLISVQAGKQAFNGLMSILNSGAQSLTPSWSGIGSAVTSQVTGLVSGL